MDIVRRAVIQIRRDREPPELLAEMGRRFVATFGADAPSDPVAVFTFSSSAQLFSVITPKRWELIEHLQGLGATSIRALSRSLGHDVRRVHEDVTALIDWGILERRDGGGVCVPYDVIQTDFDLRAAAA